MTRAWRYAWAVILGSAVQASAQSAYVGASVFGDVVRVSGSRSVVHDDTGGGEAIGFTLRVGTPLGDRWGVELEYARPSEIEDDLPISILPATRIPVGSELALPPPGFTMPAIFPPIRSRITSRHTTVSAAAWLRQDFTARTSLVYLGGLGFHRSEREFESSFDPRVLAGSIGLSILPYSTETVLYGAAPFVGIEGRIGLGEHAQLVPGFRFHGFDNTWLLRPGVGLNWMF